ncbi:MAG TPA: cytochrome c [Cyclobacteriaceae bacterium]|jgi:nitric oxide reductase subunit C|nr:cytochrome c [Cyclobacteriaceae bacterium]HRF34964.1 cytochrome c [Cyclobacteriaceae bacterium]
MKQKIFVSLILLFFAYSMFIYTQSESKSNHATSDVEAGKSIWQQNNCVACHQIYGLGGFLGPDLTNVHSAKLKGPEYIKAFVRNGTGVMPAFDLSETELNQLVSFFEHIDASGKSDPKNFRRNLDGTIELN